jgi:hypothetical protein
MSEIMDSGAVIGTEIIEQQILKQMLIYYKQTWLTLLVQSIAGWDC